VLPRSLDRDTLPVATMVGLVLGKGMSREPGTTAGPAGAQDANSVPVEGPAVAAPCRSQRWLDFVEGQSRKFYCPKRKCVVPAHPRPLL